MIVVVGSFIWVGRTVTEMTGGEQIPVKGGAVQITPEEGEKIFFGKGTCYTCHAIADRGAAVRCPNLGVMGDKFPLPIGQRADQRAAERTKDTGKKYTKTDYLLERLTDPNAYLLPGYSANVMPVIFKPPVALNVDEFKAVIVFLESIGGEPDMEGLNNPTELAKPMWAKIAPAGGGAAVAAAGGGAEISGDEALPAIFEKATCPVCHTIPGVEGAEGQIGPKLTVGTNWKKRIADKNYKGKATSAREYVMESIITPSAYVVEGFQDGVMPTDFGKKLDAAALNKIVDYISQIEEGKAPPALPK